MIMGVISMKMVPDAQGYDLLTLLLSPLYLMIFAVILSVVALFSAVSAIFKASFNRIGGLAFIFLTFLFQYMLPYQAVLYRIYR